MLIFNSFLYVYQRVNHSKDSCAADIHHRPLLRPEFDRDPFPSARCHRAAPKMIANHRPAHGGPRVLDLSSNH